MWEDATSEIIYSEEHTSTGNSVLELEDEVVAAEEGELVEDNFSLKLETNDVDEAAEEVTYSYQLDTINVDGTTNTRTGELTLDADEDNFEIGDIEFEIDSFSPEDATVVDSKVASGRANPGLERALEAVRLNSPSR